MQLRRYTIVRLILEDEGRVLLLRQTNRNGGKYTLIGGKIQVRETPIQALIRETFEESGAVIAEEDLEFVHYCYQRKSDMINMILVFRATRWAGTILNRESHKFMHVAWFPKEELPERTTKATRHILDQVRKGFSWYSEITSKRLIVK